MSDEYQALPLSDEQVAKLRSDTGDLNAAAVARFKQAISNKFHGGWELDHVRLDERQAVLRRVRVLTEVQTGVDGVKTVTPSDRSITNGKQFAEWAKLHHPGTVVLSWNSVAKQGQLGAMEADVARCREAIAQIMSCDPWDVPILVTRDKSTNEAVRFEFGLPSYFPSKHLEGLMEVATEIIGDYRWSVKVNAQTKEGVMELVPDRLDRPIPWVEEPVELERGIRIGEDEHGQPWRLRLAGTHTLCVARTAWGKGSVLWGLVRGLKSAVIDGSVVIWIIDLKGGVEAAQGREFFGRVATNHAEATQMLREARALMDARLVQMGQQRSRQHEAKPGDPALVLLFDEFTALRLAAPDSKAKAAAEAELTLLLSQGRAANVLLVAMLQSPQAKDVPARDFFPSRILGKIPNRTLVNTILGDMAKENGADATKLPDRLKGTFYVGSDGGAPPVRARAHYSTDDEIRSDADQVGRSAERHQATLDVLLASVMVDEADDDEDDDGAPKRTRKKKSGGAPVESVVPESGAWEPTNREMCSACDTPINPATGECAGCTF